MFKLLRVLEYRLGNGLQNEGLVLATGFISHLFSHSFEPDLGMTGTYWAK